MMCLPEEPASITHHTPPRCYYILKYENDRLLMTKSNTTDSKKYFKTKTHSKSQSNEHDQMMLKKLSFIHRRFTVFNLKQRISTGLTV